TALDGTHTPSYPTSSVSFNSSGVATTTLTATFYAAGTNTMTATDHNASSISGSTTITVNAGAANQFKVPTPSTQTAGVAFSETITAQDSYQNTASYSGNKTLTW